MSSAKYILTPEQRERYNSNRMGKYKGYHRATYLRKREEILARKKAERLANPELFRARGRISNAKMTLEQRARCNARQRTRKRKPYDRANEVSKAFYWRNRQRILDGLKAKRKLNPETVRTRQRAWRLKNPDKVAAQVKRRYEKQESTPELKIRHRLRNRISDALRRKSIVKSQRTLSLLSCDIDWLKAWFEIQFQPGMTWKNYGEWHVDHVKPCDKFTLTDPLEQRKCFHWTNLQPLWGIENKSKNNRLNYA